MDPSPIANTHTIITAAEQDFLKAAGLQNQMEDKGHPLLKTSTPSWENQTSKAAICHTSTEHKLEESSI